MGKNKSIKWLRRIAIYFPEYIASVALLVTLLATGINVFSRYVLKYTFFWYSDLTVLAFGWMVACGTAAAYRRHMHFGIDILVSKLPKKARAIFQIFITLLISVIMALVFYSCVLLTKNVSGKQFPTILLNYRWYDVSFVVGFGLMFIYSMIDLVKEIKTAVCLLKSKPEGSEVTPNE